MFREHAGKDLQAQVLLVTQTVSSFLEDTDLVVQAFDEAEGHLVLGGAVEDGAG